MDSEQTRPVCTHSVFLFQNTIFGLLSVIILMLHANSVSISPYINPLLPSLHQPTEHLRFLRMTPRCTERTPPRLLYNGACQQYQQENISNLKHQQKEKHTADRPQMDELDGWSSGFAEANPGWRKQLVSGLAETTQWILTKRFRWAYSLGNAVITQN
jgi:hypothetical protein